MVKVEVISDKPNKRILRVIEFGIGYGLILRI